MGGGEWLLFPPFRCRLWAGERGWLGWGAVVEKEARDVLAVSAEGVK